MDGVYGSVVEWRGVRIDLGHVHPSSREPMLAQARAWIASGERPPVVTVRAGGVDVSERPDLWPPAVRRYRGLGRIEWVGLNDDLDG